jgi:hypothetical protein
MAFDFFVDEYKAEEEKNKTQVNQEGFNFFDEKMPEKTEKKGSFASGFINSLGSGVGNLFSGLYQTPSIDSRNGL